MDMKPIPARHGDYNLQDNDAFRKQFSWEERKKQFSWNHTGKVNVAYEAIDRHANDPNKQNQPALIYAAPGREETFTFLELSRISNQFANLLTSHGIKKGDPVFLFMPQIPEFYTAFFGVLKIGAVAAPLDDTFMKQAVYDRVEDSEASVIVVTKELLERVPYQTLPHVRKIIVVGDSSSRGETFVDYQEEMKTQPEAFELEWLDLEDGMLLHYTTSSLGKPNGVYHVHHAMIQQEATAEWVLDLKPDDIYWSTTDPAWMAGTSYGIIAPWLLGVTNVVYGGEYTPEACYETLEKYGVSVWYTNPALLRLLMSQGEEAAKSYDLTSLRHLLSGGEQLHPEVITWSLRTFDLRIHDTWMMAETGAHLIVNLPCHEIRPGSMGKPIPGIEAAIIDHEGKELPPNQMGNLAIKADWPAMMRTVWKNHASYESFFMNDWFITGDRAFRDEDGYFWFQGRLDDVIHTAGKRVGPFEIESKLVEHPAVAEAGVIGKPDPVHGELIKAYITLKEGTSETEELLTDIQDFIKNSLSIHAAPDEIEVREEIPKTRSGKIMRHLLKSWEQETAAGDTTH